MAQISRPFQIGLVAVVALAGVWLFALHGHSSSSSSEPSAPPARSPASAAAQAKSAAAPSPVYHGPAPGVHGLSADVAKAHGAVATSQQNAKQLEQQSAQASSATPAHAEATSTPSASAPATVHKKTVIVHKQLGSSSGKSTSVSLVHQHQVESQLKAGNVAVVLFWDRNGSDDVAVHRAVMSLRGKQHKVAVTVASPGEVASFGSITRGVQVYGTPTVLVIGKSRQATVITGFTDTYAIQQAIAEARHP
jgi:hypothetical protein